MATKCSNCGSANTLDLLQNVNCLDCGALTDYDGEPVASGIDATGRAVIEKRLEPRGPGVVGNLADLAKAGAPGEPDSVGEVAKQTPNYDQAEAQAEAGEKADAKVTKKAAKK